MNSTMTLTSTTTLLILVQVLPLDTERKVFLSVVLRTDYKIYVKRKDRRCESVVFFFEKKILYLCSVIFFKLYV